MLNNVCVMGRLTAAPKLRHTESGTAVCSFTLAIQRNHAPSGQERQSDFIDFVAWKQTAEFLNRYFTKGQLVAIEGALQARSYTDREGNKRKAVEVVVGSVHFAEKRNQESEQQSGLSVDDYTETDDDLPF